MFSENADFGSHPHNRWSSGSGLWAWEAGQQGVGREGGDSRAGRGPVSPGDKGPRPIKAAVAARRPGEGAHGQPRRQRRRGLPAPGEEVRRPGVGGGSGRYPGRVRGPAGLPRSPGIRASLAREDRGVEATW